MRLYTYVVARDFGFAPNPFFGYCTLATCKPGIRQSARVGDLVVGTGSAQRRRGGRLVYAMRVTEVTDFDHYWRSPRFAVKQPTMHGSKKQAFGDNIYHRDPDTEEWLQANSHHSLADGTANRRTMSDDLKSFGVLISDNFVYFGGDGPIIPDAVRTTGGIDLCIGRGYKYRFPPEVARQFEAWWQSLDEVGCIGRPLDWSRSA